MKKKPLKHEVDQLRSAAVVKLLSKHQPNVPDRSAEELLHELQVHQIELEMQNESLRQAHDEMEKSRDRYLDLYDFSPISYLTLSSACTIFEANLTAANLLGAERRKLIKRRFSNFVVQEDHGRFDQYLLRVLQFDEKANCELSLMRADGSRLDVHLNGRRMEDGSGGYKVRIALTDITARKQVEADLRIAAITFDSHESLMITDANNVILRINQAFTENTGYAAEEVVGKTPRIFSSGRHNTDFYREMWESCSAPENGRVKSGTGGKMVRYTQNGSVSLPSKVEMG